MKYKIVSVYSWKIGKNCHSLLKQGNIIFVPQIMEDEKKGQESYN